MYIILHIYIYIFLWEGGTIYTYIYIIYMFIYTIIEPLGPFKCSKEGLLEGFC